ncbi:hypothetical protein ACFWU5_18360 [Nocardia sp. NPDC058640]|uniref:hypothetical protein n=1 Tax=Nocardia sp. NPDC058640 TaxID=3346571 RepID=UPI003661CCC8
MPGRLIVRWQGRSTTERDAPPPHLLDSWRNTAVTAAILLLGLMSMIWMAGQLAVHPWVHSAGLVVHFGALMLGFGSVLAADFRMMLWVIGRCSLADALHQVSRLHFPIWAGLATLIVSGCVLEPDLGSPLTVTKMVLVLALTLNGLIATALGRRLAARQTADPLPRRLLGVGAVCGGISQLCWWGAIGIGFWNFTH